MQSGIAIYDSSQLEYFDSQFRFERVEVPGEMLDECDKLLDFSSDKSVKLQIRELLPRNILSGLPESSPRVLRELLKLFESRCAAMEMCGIKITTLTPDLGRAAEDLRYAEKMRDILLCMRGIGARFGIEFFYELRLPENFENALDITRTFLRSNTLASRLLIDFHPHEPHGFDAVSAAMEKLAFLRDAWRISFEVASRNYLSEDVVKKVMNLSCRMRNDEDFIIFAPGHGADAEVFHQLAQLAVKCFNPGYGVENG